MTRTFLWRKLHSLLGIFPIGIFLFEHMFINSMALKGEGSFNQAVSILHSIPYLWALELAIIFIPIIFHALYGIWVVYLTKNNVLSYTYFRNWLFYLQRITAILALIFIGWHVWALRLLPGVNGTEVNFALVVKIFANPVVVGLYVIGLLASFGHFANGLWSFLVSWGITIGEKAQRVSAYVCTALFVILTLVGLNALMSFR